MVVDDERGEGQDGGGGPDNMPQGPEISDLPQDSPDSQSPSYSSLPSLQESTPTGSPPGTPVSGAGGGVVRDGSLPRVEGRRGRNWWEWKESEERKAMIMQSGDEGDDELTPNTSIDSDSLRRRGEPLLVIHENLPAQDHGVVAGVAAGGGGGGGDVLWGPGDGKGGGGSVGPRVAWGERTASQQPGQPPVLLQQKQQQQGPVLISKHQHQYVPNSSQPQHFHLPPRRAAPSPTPGGGRTCGANLPPRGAIASLGLGTSYIASAAPPSGGAHRSQDPPLKRVTVRSYKQNRLTPQVTSSSGSGTPSDSSPSTPTYDRRHLGDGTSSASPSVERRPEPSAPPKEEVFLDAQKRWANRGYTEVYNSHKPDYKKQPHEYPGAQQVLPDLQGSYQFTNPDTSFKQETTVTTPTSYSYQQTSSLETPTNHKESKSDDRYLESIPYAPLRKCPSKHSFTQTDLYQEIDDSLPDIHYSRAHTNNGTVSTDQRHTLKEQSPRPKDPYSGPQTLQELRPREVSPQSRGAPSAGTQGQGHVRRPSVASSSGYSTTQETEVSGAWVNQPGGGAKFVPTVVVKRDPTKPAGSLVWVNQPGGGAKLEWIPAARTPSVRSLSVTPQPPPTGHQRLPPSSPSLQRPQGPASDSRSRVANQGSPVPSSQWDGDGGGGGGGGVGGGRVKEDSATRVTRAGTGASAQPPRAGDAANGTPRVHGPSQITTGTTTTTPAPGHVPEHTYAQLNTNQYTQSKNLYSSAPGNTARPGGRTNEEDVDEGSVLTVAGRVKGQTVRIRVRPDVHAYLTGQPTAYITAALAAAAAANAASGEGRRDSDAQRSSSGSALTAGSEGEGSLGYHENDYEEVVDEYTLLQRAVDDHDPEAMQLLVQAEQALNPDNPVVRPDDPEGSEYPYIREMKERLLFSRDPPLAGMEDHHSPHGDTTDNQMLEVHQTPVGTVVKLNADGYGSHTSPTHHHHHHHQHQRVESYYTGTLESRRGLEYYPKNAKELESFTTSKAPEGTSSFITLSLLYATLLVVVCFGFILSEVLTHNVPLYYYEAFFTYLYGVSILFLLYVFCYLLSESSRERKPKQPKVFMGHHSGQYNVSEYEYYEYHEKARSADGGLPDGAQSPTTEKLTSSTNIKPKKHKTSINDHSHGSFFLRIGAIGFGLGTMIYNGLEFGVFFELKQSSPCYQILRGVNPLAQLIFTFMQMYFIFMNARLNIHKFKFLARFGLMHIVATNLCVWIRTLVRESLKEINEFKMSRGQRGEDYMILEGIRRALEGKGLMAPNKYLYNVDEFVEMQEYNDTVQLADGYKTEEQILNLTCGRVEIMGTIVSDSAPYLYPFIIEYSLIGATVIYIMWKHIGRSPRFVYPDAEMADGMSTVSRRCHSKVDCVGASKGLFCGLLVLVAALICLILFFVLVNREELKMLAIYLADVSHCAIMFLTIIAMCIGFCRVRQLKFHGEREEELDDILLMTSAFGLFAYSVFSTIAGSLSAYTKEPNLLVMATGILAVVQVIIQMVFIKDTQRRQVSLPEHERTKPGRQVVTFLLICNLTMWVIYTFETQKVEANPVQLEFFGELPWTILLRCTLPLAIFHRFHSTVVLAAIWKNSYKTRIE